MATAIRRKSPKAALAGTQDAGAESKIVAVGDLDDAAWAELDAADGIIFGAPTYMGGPSADFKKFADASSKPVVRAEWRGQGGGGFHEFRDHERRQIQTHHLPRHARDAARHAVGRHRHQEPSNTKAATRNDLNFVGGFTGLLAQSPADASPDEAPPPGDLETAKAFGARVAAVTARWTGR